MFICLSARTICLACPSSSSTITTTVLTAVLASHTTMGPLMYHLRLRQAQRANPDGRRQDLDVTVDLRASRLVAGFIRGQDAPASVDEYVPHNFTLVYRTNLGADFLASLPRTIARAMTGQICRLLNQLKLLQPLLGSRNPCPKMKKCPRAHRIRVSERTPPRRPRQRRMSGKYIARPLSSRGLLPFSSLLLLTALCLAVLHCCLTVGTPDEARYVKIWVHR